MVVVTRNLLALLVFGMAVGTVSGQEPNPNARIRASLGNLPLYFVANRGVYPEEVKYYIQGADKTLFFTRDGVTFRLKGMEQDRVVKLEFVGANPKVQPEGQDKQQAVFSYFKGSEKDWQTGLKTFSTVVYRDLWPGIDLVYSGTVNKLKYEFLVAPGADPAQIRLQYRGAESVAITEGGALRVTTPTGSFEDAPPVAWQEIDGKRVHVEVSFRLDPGTEGEGTTFALRLGRYDRTRSLVLDPAVIVYCGYIGRGGVDGGRSIAVDAAGNAYVTGVSSGDAFVAKVNATGTALVYCSYIGGSPGAYGLGIAVDGAGNAYVTGYTLADQNTFPVKIGPDLTYNGKGMWDYGDAFVAKVNAQGTALVYCGYIGGSSDELPSGMAVDAAGNAYVTGWTESDENSFPVCVGPDQTFNGQPTDRDAFVAKVSADGSRLIYCGYIGGATRDQGAGIAVDVAGNAYIAGHTASTQQQNFPVLVGPELTYDGQYDAFVAKVNAQGTALVYCGYIGGTAPDEGAGIAVDVAGNAYVTGYTASDEKTFPVKGGPDLTYNSTNFAGDVFVAKVNASGKALDYCGYIGGSEPDYGFSIAVDGAGNAYVAGDTASDEKSFPVKIGPDLTYNGSLCDAFVAKVNAQGTALVYCGYIGGAERDGSFAGIAVDAAGNAYVTGWTYSTEQQNFPVLVGPDLTHNGGWDAFVAKVALTLLEASGTPRPGGTINLSVTASDAAGLSYQLGTSLGTGPIPIDTRKIDLSPDGLLAVSVGGWWPSIFSGYRGVIGTNGQAQAVINIPNIPALIGIHLYTAFVTLDPQAPSGIKSISNTFSFVIAK